MREEGVTPSSGFDPDVMDRFIAPLSTLVSRYWEAAETAHLVSETDDGDPSEAWLVMLGGASLVDKDWLKAAQSDVSEAHSEFWRVISDRLLELVPGSASDDDHSIRTQVAGALYWKTDCPGSVVHSVLDPSGATKATSRLPAIRDLAPVMTVKCQNGHSFEWRQKKRSERSPESGACPTCREEAAVDDSIQELEEKEIRRVRTTRSVGGIDSQRLQRLKTMPYREYLQTPEWRATTLAAKKRAGFKCSLCGTRKNFETHHNTYDNRGCEPDEDLVVLCRECHQNFHDMGELVKEEGPQPAPREESPEFDDAGMDDAGMDDAE